jgi:hypothetical protein
MDTIFRPGEEKTSPPKCKNILNFTAAGLVAYRIE